jgi:hypothetical protein
MKICTFGTNESQAHLNAPLEVIDQCCPEPPRSLLSGWSAPVFELINENDFGRDLPKSDFPPLMIGTIVLSARAVDLLHPILTPCGEILPIRCSNDSDDFFLFNVTRIINAVDMKRSKFMPLPSGAIGPCERLVFDPKRIPGAALFFKTTQLGAGCEIYATESAVRAVKQTRLTGYKFDLVWSDDDDQ